MFIRNQIIKLIKNGGKILDLIIQKSGGWMGRWVGGWTCVKAILRIAYRNQQTKWAKSKQYNSEDI